VCVVSVSFHSWIETQEASLGNDKSSSEREMSALVEASSLVRRVAEPCPAGDSVKAAMLRSARKLRWNYTRVRAFWYADDRVKVTGDELNELRAAAQTTEAKDEVLARLESVEQMLRALASRMPQDADFYGSHADTLRGVASRVGRQDHSD
jgi:hypothetical protein